MSFEDDMIEDGFSDEQDYLDYICSEAYDRMGAERYEDDYYHKNRISPKQLEERSRLIQLDKEMREWLQSDTLEVKFWEVYEHGNWGHRWSEDICSRWDRWRNGSVLYDKWEEEHLEELESLEKDEFAEQYLQFCEDFIDNNRNPHFLAGNNGGLIKMAGITPRKVHYDERKMDVAIWFTAVNDPSQDNVYFDNWQLDHMEEWENWLHVNYPYLKASLIHTNKDLSKFLENLDPFPRGEITTMEQEEKKSIISKIAEEQMSDWWDLFVEDTRKKFTKAVELGYDDYFWKKNENTDNPPVSNPVEYVFHNIYFFVHDSSDEWIPKWRRRRPISHPELKYVQAVLAGAYKDDLISDEIDEDESREVLDERMDRIHKELESEFLFESEDSVSSGVNDDMGSAYDRREKVLRQLFAEKSEDAVSKALPESLRDYLSTIPQQNVSYEDYEYYAPPTPIYYYCKGRINAENIDAFVNVSSLSYRLPLFKYKGYKYENAFVENELNYDHFNDWCIMHNLPTFEDYAIKYWCSILFNENNACLYFWTRYWRGRVWAQEKFGYESKSKEELFQMWVEKHNDEWKQYKDEGMYKYARDAYSKLWQLFDWIKGKNYSMEEIWKRKRDYCIKSLLSQKEEAFDRWLRCLTSSYVDLAEWKKKNRLLLPLLKRQKQKQERIALWNKAYPNEKIIIPGIND